MLTQDTLRSTYILLALRNKLTISIEPHITRRNLSG